MMMRLRTHLRWILVLPILLLLALLIVNSVGAKPLGSDAKEALVFSGTLEAKQTRVAAEISARVMSIQVGKGEKVKKGDTLVELEASSVLASAAEAESAVKTAQANLDLAKETARAGTIGVAEAGLAQAQADLKAAQSALNDANRALASPQELTSQMHGLEGKVQSSTSEVEQAQAGITSIQAQLKTAQNDQSAAGKYRAASLQAQLQGAQLTLSAAQANLAGNQKLLEMYRQLVKNPLELVAAKNAAEKQVKVAEAGVKAAQAELEWARRPPQPEAVALAEAKLQAAKAALKLVELQVTRYRISSPLDGIVIDRLVDPGETTRAGSAVIVLGKTDELQMTLFVPIRYLSSIHIGQDVLVRLPSVTGKAFAGQVTYISSEAEFKPANLYNSQDRSEIVYAVRVTVPNDGQELKAGLPADAEFK